MSTRLAVEEIEVTTGEKLLAVVLAIFISSAPSGHTFESTTSARKTGL